MSNLRPVFLLVICFLFLRGVSLFAESSKLDSLYQVLNQNNSTKSTEEVASLYYLLVSEHSLEENWQQVIEISNEALQYTAEKEFFSMQGDFMYYIGLAYRRLTQYEQALISLKQAIELPKDNFRNIIKADVYTDLAKIYQSQGDYKASYQYFLKVLILFETDKDSLNIARTLYGIGSMRFYQDNFQDALKYYMQSQALCEKLGNERGLYSSLGGIASVYAETGEYKKALKYNITSLDIARKLGTKSGVAYALLNIGGCYIGLGEHRKAEDYLLRAIELKRNLGDNWGLIGAYQSLSEVYADMGDLGRSIQILNEAMMLASEMGSKPRVLNIYSTYAEVYEVAGKVELANKYLHSYILLKDTLLNESSIREMRNAKSTYEVQKRESKIALLTSQKALLEQEKKIKNLNYYLMGASLLFMLTLTLIWFSRFRMQKRLVGLLEEKNDQIHRQNKQLELSNEDLQQFAYVASHDLKEPLRMISSYTSLLKKRYHHLFDEQAEEFMFYVVDAVGRMQILLDDLLTYSRVETSGGNQQWIESTDVIAIVASNLRMAISENKVDIQVHYDQLPKILADRSQMIQLFQNLISNAIKFVDTDQPVVEVGYRNEKGKMALYVKDNGIGIDEKSKEKIFEMFHRLHSKEEFEGTGIGLATCKRIVDRHMGDIWVESKKGKGSTFFIALPEASFAPSGLKKEGVSVA